jgi:hypothetical protein
MPLLVASDDPVLIGFFPKPSGAKQYNNAHCTDTYLQSVGSSDATEFLTSYTDH